MAQTPLRCIAIDDEPVALEILRDYIEQTPFLDLSAAFRSALTALDYLRKHKIDLVFLDINMPDLTGIQFMKALDRPPLVIFTTAYSQYALESYDYEAVDYLLKPIEFDRFLKAANRALARITTRREESALSPATNRTTNAVDSESILIKSGRELHKVRWKDILYAKGTGNYTTFVTLNKDIMALMTMKKALNILPGNHFFRIHKSYIIHFRHVDVIEKDRVRIKDTWIPIGEAYRHSFLKRIHPSE
jgi:two-component system LytT family response regulator